MNFIKKGNASFFLFLNAFLWGSSYVWSKLLLTYLPRFTILLLCSIGGFAACTIMFFPHIRKIKVQEILPSLVVIMFSIFSNTFFIFALQYTSSSNAAFIVQSSVIITPLIMAIAEKKMPHSKVIFSAVTALAGLFLITCSFDKFRINPGDVLALGNALFFSLFLIGQKRISAKVNTIHFSFLHHASSTLVFLLFAGLLEFPHLSLKGLDTYKFILPAIASILIVVVTVLFQSAALFFVRPEKATLIYTLEPLAAFVLGSVIIGEKLTGVNSIAGSILIIAAVLVSTLNIPVQRDLFKGKSKKGCSTYLTENSSIKINIIGHQVHDI